jgi:hypothetical protein
VRTPAARRSACVAIALALALTVTPARAADDDDDAPTEVSTPSDDAPTDGAPGPTDGAPAPPDEGPPPIDRAAAIDAERPIVVWPTLTPGGDDPSAGGLRRPAPTEGATHLRAQELDATLRDAVQDLGFALDVVDPGPAAGHARDLDMIERARRRVALGAADDAGTWVVSARLEPLGNDAFLLRIVAVPPKGKQLRVRVERVTGADVSVRALVLLRDLLTSTPAGERAEPPPQESASSGIMSPLRSQGRAILAANAALFGAFAAFSVQRASGSTDPRLLYPLLTLGTGIGLGGALLVAEEWNIGTGDAWTLAGGAWWGAASGLLLANGRRIQPLSDRYAWGVGGGLIGLSLATFSLTRSKADEGDAVLVHSGAALGLSLGSLGDLFVHGRLERTPHIGAGFGTATGLIAAGTLATFVQVSPSRILLIDLGAGLGAAAGAAVGSPLVFENVTEAKARGFIAATTAGTLLGGGVAWWLTRDRSDRAAPVTGGARVTPFGGVVGASATRTGFVPAYGVGVRGPW